MTFLVYVLLIHLGILCSNGASETDKQQIINNADDLLDLYPFIKELISVNELKDILLNKITSNQAGTANETYEAKPKKKVGGIILPKDDKKLRKLKIEQNERKQELDEFLSQNELQNVFNNITFFRNNITIDVITYDNNRLNYTINNISNIVCDDIGCTDFDKLRLISSIAKTRNIQKINFNQKQLNQLRMNLVKKEDINTLNEPTEAQQEINQYMIIMKTIIDDFENMFKNETQNIDQIMDEVTINLKMRQSLLLKSLNQWKDNKIIEIQQSINNVSKNNYNLQKSLNKSYEMNVKNVISDFPEIFELTSYVNQQMSFINEVASIIEFITVDIIPDIRRFGLIQPKQVRISPIIEIINDSIFIIDTFKNNNTFSMSLSWKYYYSKYDDVDINNVMEICNKINININGTLQSETTLSMNYSIESGDDVPDFVRCNVNISNVKFSNIAFKIGVKYQSTFPIKMVSSDEVIQSFPELLDISMNETKNSSWGQIYLWLFSIVIGGAVFLFSYIKFIRKNENNKKYGIIGKDDESDYADGTDSEIDCDESVEQLIE